MLSSFNPRTHTGCDPTCLLIGFGVVGFNPRTHTGCDIVKMFASDGKHVFQSTHPHGVRPEPKATEWLCKLVSIHAPTRGATALLNFDAIVIEVSIHAPTRGATQCCRESSLVKIVSIHAPTRGATESTIAFHSAVDVSIHAPTRGATLPFLRIAPSLRFQSTHPHGVRQRHAEQCRAWWCFNPRTHTGCDLTPLKR